MHKPELEGHMGWLANPQKALFSSTDILKIEVDKGTADMYHC